MLKTISLVSIVVVPTAAPTAATAGAKPSVFHLQTLLGQPTLQGSTWIATNVKGDDALTNMEKAACRSAGLTRCPDFEEAQMGSVFFIKPDLILTTLHGFRDYLKARVNIDDKFENVEVPLLISRDGGEVVFGNKPGDRAFVTPLIPGAKQSLMNDSLNTNVEYDLAYVRLSRSIGTPVRLSKSQLNIGDQVTTYGFSDDSPNTAQDHSGTIISKTSAPHCASSSAGAAKTQLVNYEPHFGLSGAPAFNASGEVVGLHLAGCRNISVIMPISEIPLE